MNWFHFSYSITNHKTIISNTLQKFSIDGDKNEDEEWWLRATGCRKKGWEKSSTIIIVI